MHVNLCFLFLFFFSESQEYIFSEKIMISQKISRNQRLVQFSDHSILSFGSSKQINYTYSNGKYKSKTLSNQIFFSFPSTSKLFRIPSTDTALIMFFRHEQSFQFLGLINLLTKSIEMVQGDNFPKFSQSSGPPHFSTSPAENIIMITYIGGDNNNECVIATLDTLAPTKELTLKYTFNLSNPPPADNYHSFQCDYNHKINFGICIHLEYQAGNTLTVNLLNTQDEFRFSQELPFPMTVKLSDDIINESTLYHINNDYDIILSVSQGLVATFHVLQFLTESFSEVTALHKYTHPQKVKQTDIVVMSSYICFSAITENDKPQIILFDIQTAMPFMNLFQSVVEYSTFALGMISSYKEDALVMINDYGDNSVLCEFWMFQCKDFTINSFINEEQEINFNDLTDEVNDEWTENKFLINSLEGDHLKVTGMIQEERFDIVGQSQEHFSKLLYTCSGVGETKINFSLVKFIADLTIISTNKCSVTIVCNCHSLCRECNGKGDDSDNKCTKCWDKYEIEEGTSNCEKKDKCYDSCLTCYGKGNEINNKCLSCKNTYIHKDYYTKRDSDKANCIHICNPNYSYYTLLRSNDSIDVHCYNNKTHCPPEYPFTYNNTKNCTNLCEEKEGLEVSIGDDINDFLKAIQLNQECFLKLEKTFKGEGFTVQFLEFSLEKGLISGVPEEIEDFDVTQSFRNEECKNILKKYYNLSSDELLNVVMIEYNSNTKTPFNQKEYQVYLKNSTEKLNLGLCSNVTLMQRYKVKGDNKLTESSKEFIKMGLNPFDITGWVFNDYCEPCVVSIDGFEITINDRRKYYFDTTQICDYNCKFQTAEFNDPEDETIECSCVPKVTFSKPNEYTLENSYVSPVSDSNVKLFRCYKSFFNDYTYKKSLGFYLMLSLFLLQVLNLIFAVIYLRKANEIEVKTDLIAIHNCEKNNRTKRENDVIIYGSPKKKILKSPNHAQSHLRNSSFETENSKIEILNHSQNSFVNCLNNKKNCRKVTWVNLGARLAKIIRNHMLIGKIICQKKNERVNTNFYLSLFILTISNHFGLGCLLYSDSLISKYYRTKARILLIDELVKSIACVLLTFFYNIFSSFLFNMRGNTDHYGWNQILYYVLLFIVNLTWIYYVTIFNYVHFRLLNWWIVISCIDIFAHIIVFPLLKCLLIYIISRLIVKYKFNFMIKIYLFLIYL